MFGQLHAGTDDDVNIQEERRRYETIKMAVVSLPNTVANPWAMVIVPFNATVAHNARCARGGRNICVSQKTNFNFFPL